MNGPKHHTKKTTAFPEEEVLDTLDVIFGKSDSEIEEETSGSDSQSDNDDDNNFESASKSEKENGIDYFDTDMSADQENLLRACGTRHGIACVQDITWEFYEDIDPF